MSRFRLPAAALLLLLSTACGNTQIVAVHGVLNLSPSVADFHIVCLRSTSEFDLTLENTGQGALKIKSTSFTNPTFSLLEAVPAEVPARSKVIIKLGFTPTIAKDYSAFFKIDTDAPKNGSQQITLIGTGFDGQDRDFEVSCLCDNDASNGLVCGLTGDGHMTVRPCDFLSFNGVVGGTSLQRTITVENRGCQPLNFTQAILADDTDSAANAAQYLTWFSFDPSGDLPPPQAILGGASQDYVVQFSPPAGAEATPIVSLQLVSDDATAPHPGQTTAGTWDVGMISNAIAPSLQVTPNILTFFDATMNVPDTKQFTIRNNGQDTLHIDSISLSGSGEFTVQQPANMNIGPTTSIGVNVTFTATSGGGATGTVSVSAAGQTQKVSLVGGSEPVLAVTWLTPGTSTQNPVPVDWGTTSIGDMNVTRTVQLANTGAADLVITKLATRDVTNSADSTSFSVSGSTPITIQSGHSTTVTVTFNDNIYLRDDAGTLVIYSNNPADTPNGGFEAVPLKSTNTAVFKPVPDISVSAEPQACKSLTLDASQSNDPQGSPLSYQWALTLVPNGSKATLSSTSGVMTSITSPSCQGPDLPGNYVVTLTVSDQYPNNSNSITQAISVQ